MGKSAKRGGSGKGAASGGKSNGPKRGSPNRRHFAKMQRAYLMAFSTSKGDRSAARQAASAAATQVGAKAATRAAFARLVDKGFS